MIEGIGPEAEIVTNSKGGKESKAIGAAYLIDPEFLSDYYCYRIDYDGSDPDVNVKLAIVTISKFMKFGNKINLIRALQFLDDEPMISIAKVLQEGADRYKPNNWRLIPSESHINHALLHLFAFLAGDTQDNHIAHAMTRIMMGYATERSQDFDYTHYIEEVT